MLVKTTNPEIGLALMAAILDFTSGFIFDHFFVIGMFCVCVPNFIQIGPLRAEL